MLTRDLIEGISPRSEVESLLSQLCQELFSSIIKDKIKDRASLSPISLFQFFLLNILVTSDEIACAILLVLSISRLVKSAVFYFYLLIILVLSCNVLYFGYISYSFIDLDMGSRFQCTS